MFTGIVQAVGVIAGVRPAGRSVELEVEAPGLEMTDVAVGDSIAVDGVCLTVTAIEGKTLRFDVSQETLAVAAGFCGKQRVNVEKSLRLADRLGGHLVSGHVDAVGEVAAVTPVDGNREIAIRFQGPIGKYFARKGSVTVNGVSLTINAVDHQSFTLNLIPHTLAMTNLGELAPGRRVNLEVDLVARYVERMLSDEGGKK
ncbi:MAG TPA: riboflavin synthase [Burkholderiales bacterium]|nr:riboflavin synthase [Burkholderiales bacterium]